MYLNAHKRVNTILTHLLRLAPPRATGRCATAQRDAATWTLGQGPIARSPDADREILSSGKSCYGLGGGVGRGRGVGVCRGGGTVAVAVAVAVAVGVGECAVAVAVGVGVGLPQSMPM